MAIYDPDRNQNCKGMEEKELKNRFMVNDVDNDDDYDDDDDNNYWQDKYLKLEKKHRRFKKKHKKLIKEQDAEYAKRLLDYMALLYEKQSTR